MNNSSTQHETEPKSDVWDSDSSDGAGKTMQRREKARTKPRGGKTCLYMDPKEVKACRELGFELENDDDDDYYNHDQEKQEHHHEENDYYNNMKIITKRSSSLSREYSSTSSSTGDMSPIQNWRISSPGDDPQDVKARLKVWAQAVALESTSQMQH